MYYSPYASLGRPPPTPTRSPSLTEPPHHHSQRISSVHPSYGQHSSSTAANDTYTISQSSPIPLRSSASSSATIPTPLSTTYQQSNHRRQFNDRPTTTNTSSTITEKTSVLHHGGGDAGGSIKYGGSRNKWTTTDNSSVNSIRSNSSSATIPAATPPPELELQHFSNPDVVNLNAALDEMLRVKESVHIALGMEQLSSGRGGSGGGGMFRSNVLLGTLLTSPVSTGSGPTVSWSEVERRIIDLAASVDECERQWTQVRKAGQVERSRSFTTAIQFGSDVSRTSSSLMGHYRHSRPIVEDESPLRILPLKEGRRGEYRNPVRAASTSWGTSYHGDVGGRSASHTGGRTTSIASSTDAQYSHKDVAHVTTDELEWRGSQQRWFRKVEEVIMEGKFALLEARRLSQDWVDHCSGWAVPLEQAMMDRDFPRLLHAIGVVTSEAPHSLQVGLLGQTIQDAKEFARHMKDASEDGKTVVESQSDLAVWTYLDTYEAYLPVAVKSELRALGAKRKEYKNRLQFGGSTTSTTTVDIRHHSELDEEAAQQRAVVLEERRKKAKELAANKRAQADAFMRAIKSFEVNGEGSGRQSIVDDERKGRILLTKAVIESEASAMGVESKRQQQSKRQEHTNSNSSSSQPLSSFPQRGAATTSSSSRLPSIERGSGASSPLLGASGLPPRVPSSTVHFLQRQPSTVAGGGSSGSVKADSRKTSFALLNSRRVESFSAIPHVVETISTSANNMLGSRDTSTIDLLEAASAAVNSYRYLRQGEGRDGSPISDDCGDDEHRLIVSRTLSSAARVQSNGVASGGGKPIVKYSFRRSTRQSGDGSESSSSSDDVDSKDRSSSQVDPNAATVTLRDVM